VRDRVRQWDRECAAVRGAVRVSAAVSDRVAVRGSGAVCDSSVVVCGSAAVKVNNTSYGLEPAYCDI
jgi:hypothetical protein